MSSIYLAALYSQMFAMQDVAQKLREAGHEITSKWIDGDEEKKLTREEAAIMDRDDVDAADTVICFSLPKGTLHNGGGRHWEFGYAYAKGKRIIIVGPLGEHVFHHLPTIIHYNDLESAMANL